MKGHRRRRDEAHTATCSLEQGTGLPKTVSLRIGKSPFSHQRASIIPFHGRPRITHGQEGKCSWRPGESVSPPPHYIYTTMVRTPCQVILSQGARTKTQQMFFKCCSPRMSRMASSSFVNWNTNFSLLPCNARTAQGLSPQLGGQGEEDGMCCFP